MSDPNSLPAQIERIPHALTLAQFCFCEFWTKEFFNCHACLLQLSHPHGKGRVCELRRTGSGVSAITSRRMMPLGWHTLCP